MQHEGAEHCAPFPLLHLLHTGSSVRLLSPGVLTESKSQDNSANAKDQAGTDIITRVGAITSRRRNRRLNAADPGPKQLQRAQRKLSTVTACSTIGSPTTLDRSSSACKDANDDVEATAAQLELGEW